MYDFDEDNFITLTDEDGNEVDFLLLDVFEVEGSDYMVLIPLTDESEDEEEDELFFLRAEKTEEGEIYSSIEDEETLKKVSDAYEVFFLQKARENGSVFVDAIKPDADE